MKQPLGQHGAAGPGFTLIELLVVIAIIAVLAGILLPTLAYAKKATKSGKVARMEMAHLQTAIAQYETDYNRMPLSNEALKSTTLDCPDFTCGTVTRDGSVIAQIAIKNPNNNGYQNVNSELLAPLRNLPIYPNEKNALNPRKTTYFESRDAASNTQPGIGPDGVFRDPWGTPYIVTLDLNDDGKCQDALYYVITKNKGDQLIAGPSMIWSLGPDRQASDSRGAGPKLGVNKDNVLHWE